jgi:intracellular septation protein A
MIKHLVRAASPVLFDSVGMLFFAALLALHVSIAVATVIGMVIACGVVVWGLGRGRRVPALQWTSLAIVLVAAGATLFTGDPRFVMAKPTIIYLAIGFAMLQRGWMLRYVDPNHVDDIRDLMTASGYVWAGLMFVTAGANLIVALAFTAWWPAFIGIFPLASKLVLFAVNFTIAYAIARARRRRARHGGTHAPAVAAEAGA